MSTLVPLIRMADGRANLISDAHLAALAIEQGFVLCSTRRRFRSFPRIVLGEAARFLHAILFLAQFVLDFAQRQAIHHVLFRKPAFARDADAEP